VGVARVKVKKLVIDYLSDETGVAALEYGIIAALVAVVLISAVSSLGTHLRATFNSISSSL
jgi:pilus assembly protein Flp/PilA